MVVTIGVVVFATTTMMGWVFYGERCVVYLFGTKGIVSGIVGSATMLVQARTWASFG